MSGDVLPFCHTHQISSYTCHITAIQYLMSVFVIIPTEKRPIFSPRKEKTVKQMSGWKMAVFATRQCYYSSSISKTEWSVGTLGRISIESFGKKTPKKTKWLTEHTLWWIFQQWSKRTTDSPIWLLLFRMRTYMNIWGAEIGVAWFRCMSAEWLCWLKNNTSINMKSPDSGSGKLRCSS